MKVPQIQSTKSYDLFQIIDGNRPISPSYVKNLVEDPVFLRKSYLSPIVVSSDHSIIDGQHRFTASKQLEIPIYFLVDDDADSEDIRCRNENQHNWRGIDFISFYANENDTYMLIKNLKEKYALPLSFINSAIIKFGSFKLFNYSYDQKKGKLNLSSKVKKQLTEFMDIYVPRIKEFKKIRGEVESLPLFMGAYVTGFCHFFEKDRGLFDKVMTKLIKFDSELPHTSTFAVARDAIVRISKWVPKKVK